MRARSLSRQGWPVSEPPERTRAVGGLHRRPRPRGCPSLWLLSLGQARESDSLAMDGERKDTGTWVGSRDSAKTQSKVTGSRLSPGRRELGRTTRTTEANWIPASAGMTTPAAAIATPAKPRQTLASRGNVTTSAIIES